MKLIRTILAVATKELQVFVRDRGRLVVIFVLPLVIATFFGMMNDALGGEEEEGESGPKLPVYLINQDTGPYGEQMTDILFGIDVLDIETVDTVEEADQSIADGERLAAIVLPAGFSDHVDAYEPSTVQVIVDPTQQEYASIVTGIINEVVAPFEIQGELQYGIRSVMTASGLFEGADPALQRAAEAQTLGVLMTQVQASQTAPLIAVESETSVDVEAYRPESWLSVFMPGFTVMFAFYLVPSLSEDLLKEKEEGTLRRLIASPMRRGAILLGKVLAYLLIGIVQVLFIFGFGNAVLRMPLGDSYLGLLVVSVALALSSASLGLMFAALFRSRQQADAVSMVLSFVLAGLGGSIQIGIRPIYRYKGFLGILSRLTPHANALEGFRRLMIEGKGLVEVLPQVAFLVGLSAICFLIAVWRFRYD